MVRRKDSCTEPFGKEHRRRMALFEKDINRNEGDNEISPGSFKAGSNGDPMCVQSAEVSGKHGSVLVLSLPLLMELRTQLEEPPRTLSEQTHP